MNLTRLAASLAAAATVTLAGVGAGTGFAAPVEPVTPVTPVTPVHPVTPVTPSYGSGTHHESHAGSSSAPVDGGSALPLVLGGLGIAVVAGGGAYALARGNAADRDRERRVAGPGVQVVTVPPQGYAPRYEGRVYEGRR
jgi:hypothetical protein